MREQHKIYAGDIHGEVVPVHQAQLFKALEQATIHQKLLFRRFDEVFGAGYGTGCAQEVDEDFFVHKS
jgi:hypothetical protein